MEIKVKKEKEPELKLKKEAQVTVHKKNPILSAKEKKAAFTSKPVADRSFSRLQGFWERLRRIPRLLLKS